MLDGNGRSEGLEKKFSSNIRRYRVREPEKFRNQYFRLHPSIGLFFTEHDRVHEHPSQKRWGGSLVKASHALLANCLQEAVNGTSELRFWSGLQSHFDSIKT